MAFNSAEHTPSSTADSDGSCLTGSATAAEVVTAAELVRASSALKKFSTAEKRVSVGLMYSPDSRQA